MTVARPKPSILTVEPLYLCPLLLALYQHTPPYLVSHHNPFAYEVSFFPTQAPESWKTDLKSEMCRADLSHMEVCCVTF